VLHDICDGLLEPDEADARPRRCAPTQGHAFTIPIPRVEHSFIQQAGSNGPHWAMGQSRIRMRRAPNLEYMNRMKRMKKVITCSSVVSFGFCASIFLPAGSAHADLCPYPGIGSGGGALFAQGGFCDYPTEINGSHMHCEAGGFGVNGILGQSTNGSSFAFGGAGIGALSCTWRCPDGAMAPAPNPPGLWREYMVVMNSTNFCKDHMAPDGFWSAPVLPTEGVPPEERSTETPEIPGRPVPAPVPPAPALQVTPGIPGALTPGIPNP
jgi:hypothetical protein